MPRLLRLAAVLLYLGLAFGAYAQVTTAIIRGMVLDSSGAVVPGAQVTVANQQSVPRETTRTDGLYDLAISSISGPGFRDGGAGIFLKSGSTSTIDQSIAIINGRHSLKLGLKYQMLFVRGTDASVPAFGIPLPVNSVTKASIRPGTLGHRAVFGPGWWSTDLALSKRLRFTERWNLQLRADMFNAFNHTNFDSVVTGLRSAAFGQFASNKGARVVQLNGHLQF